MDRIKNVQRRKTERGISYTEANKQMDIFNSVKSTYAQAAAATKPAVIQIKLAVDNFYFWMGLSYRDEIVIT